MKTDAVIAELLVRNPGVADAFARHLPGEGGGRVTVYVRLAETGSPIDLARLQQSTREAFKAQVSPTDREIPVDVILTDRPGPEAEAMPIPPERHPTQLLEEPAVAAAWSPPETVLAGAFAARALRAIDHLANELSDDTLAGAVSARTDFDTLFRAFLAIDLVQETGDPLAPARLRGLQASRDLLNAEGGALSGEEIGKLLGISRQAIHARRKAGKLLGLETGRHGLRYPSWQVTSQGLLPGLEEALAVLQVDDPWMRARFFLAENPRLDDRRPLDLLREGRTEPVLEAARTHGEHGAA